MMPSLWNILILSGVAAAALVSIGNNRYLSWLAALSASYVISVLYWDFHLPASEFFAAMCDIAVVVAVVIYARYMWELWFGLASLIMAFVNWLYLADKVAGSGLIGHDVYSFALEALNLAAISMIGFVAAFDKNGSVNGVAFRPWLHIFGRLRPVYSSRDPRP